MTLWYCIFAFSAGTNASDLYEIDRKFKNIDCIDCHLKTNPGLIAGWRNSSHSNLTAAAKEVADCLTCHGDSHKGAAGKSRKNSTCVGCHGGDKAPVIHSYKSSKHGAIMQMTAKNIDWGPPLKQANYRVPGCAYCHMYNKQHDTRQSIRRKKKQSDLTQMPISEEEQLFRKTVGVCVNCHALRYIKRLFESGERMQAIAWKKYNEAMRLVDDAEKKFSRHEIASLKTRLAIMQQHLNNVYLGVGHQSPDYQWWYGQPALDGDLIKIKGLITDLNRMLNIRIKQVE